MFSKRFSLIHVSLIVLLTAVSAWALNDNWPEWIDKYKDEIGLWNDGRTDCKSGAFEDDSTLDVFELNVRDSIILEPITEGELTAPDEGEYRFYILQSSLELMRYNGSTYLAAAELSSTTDAATVSGWVAAATDRPLVIYDYMSGGVWYRKKLDVLTS